MSDLSPGLIADMEESLLGDWDDDVMAVVRQPYTAGALRSYAWSDGGWRIPAEQVEAEDDEVHPAPCWYPYHKPCTCFDGPNAGGAA